MPSASDGLPSSSNLGTDNSDGGFCVLDAFRVGVSGPRVALEGSGGGAVSYHRWALIGFCWRQSYLMCCCFHLALHVRM